MAARKTGKAAKATGAKKAAKARATTKAAPSKKTAGAAKKAASATKVASKKAPAKKAASGRAGTAGKAEGDEAVRAWIEAVKPGQRAIVERLDALIGQAVPDVKRAVKWSMPMYGRAGHGWFAHIGSFKEFVALGFFAGASLKPEPPFGEGVQMRRARIQDMGEFDEKQLRSWIEQAAAIPGWGKA